MVATYPGLFRDVKTYLKERVGEVASGAGEPIVLRVYGDDLTLLREKAEEIKGIIGDIDGVVDEQTTVSDGHAAARGQGRPGQGRCRRAQAG